MPTKKIVIILGIFLIVLGGLVYIILPMFASTQSVANHEAITALPGSSVPRVFHIPSGADVTGTINQVAGQEADDINFYVFDKANYQSWTSQQPRIWYVYIYRATTNTPFSFRTDKEDDYYFVFDNPAVWFNSERSINWSASYTYKPYAVYAMPVAVILVIVGAVVIVVGFITKTKQENIETQKTPPIV